MRDVIISTLKGLGIFVAVALPGVISAGIAYSLGQGELAPLWIVAPYLLLFVLFMAWLIGDDLSR